jgi:hypothetical protein
MWIGKDVKGIFDDQFEEPCEFDQMIQDNVMT